uniref:Uncharacterized protein n=1 Tax=Aegilops tauschii subsp. strangulata TaxID=200361 RepID=A0A453RWG8_AEGTS
TKHTQKIGEIGSATRPKASFLRLHEAAPPPVRAATPPPSPPPSELRGDLPCPDLIPPRPSPQRYPTNGLFLLCRRVERREG